MVRHVRGPLERWEVSGLPAPKDRSIRRQDLSKRFDALRPTPRVSRVLPPQRGSCGRIEAASARETVRKQVGGISKRTLVPPGPFT
ncbi:hypothetical protein F750_6096 [Streptomyces sp. PAMC 26508]|nr:hypothetical protein F750_6096 [Streptomyces sp. PAMC 26508]